MSEADERAAKAARAKAMLKKRQAAAAKKVGSGSERAFSPAPSEPPAQVEKEKPRDMSDVFGNDDLTSGDTTWLSSLTRAPSPPPVPPAITSPTSPPLSLTSATSPPPQTSIPSNGHVDEELRPESESSKDGLGELDILKSRNDSLQAEVEALKSEREAAFGKLNTLTTRFGELEAMKEKSEASKVEVVKNLDTIKTQLQKSESLLKEEQHQSQQLRERVEQIQAEKDNSIRNEQRTISLLVSEKSALTSELERLGDVDAKAQNIEDQLAQEQEKSRNWDVQLEELKAEMRNTSTRNQVLQVKEKELTEKSREQERQLQLANGTIASLRKESEAHQRKVKELEEQIESDDRAEKLEASLKNTQDRADELEFQLSKLKRAHTDLKTEREDLESRLNNHRDGEDVWKSKHSDLEQQQHSLQQQLTTVSSEKDTLLQEKSTLETEVGKAQEMLALLQGKLKQAAEDLAVSTHHLKAAQTEAKNAIRRAEDAERTQKDLQSEGMNLMHSLDEMRPKIVELTGAKLELSEMVEGLERALSNRDQVISQLEVSLQDVRDEKEMLEKQWQDMLSEREKERTNAEDSSNELQKAYDKLQEELDSALASVQSLESNRAQNHQDAGQRLQEVERLTILTISQSEELAALKQEVEQRSSEQAEGEGFIERAQNEIEILRQELNTKDEEIQRLKGTVGTTANTSPRSLDDEMLGSYKQQHDLELSAAQSHIRSLETALFDAEARSHSLTKQVSALEGQLASYVHHRSSPPVPSRPSSQHSNDLHRAAVTSSSRLNPSSAIIRRTSPAYEQNLSPETRHKRKVSLSMLKARIDRELVATSQTHSRSMSPVPSVAGSNDGSLSQRSRPSTAMGIKSQGLHVRPQFLDDSHVFWCSSCRGDLVVL
ncbi:hypothetical protein E1B28_001652 [Marasmius oreades]|uniref:Uncharacterized protein n=1 Tax=Marasmius oreades TaxID=181124 RepID=A0A9P7V3X4_9AGAR|nr:uncharacterized protein E1B28_001652 [Marasmius oreades]KAG7099845.1 hypothetical protein E1B28_001652 [Marasmius oreades]